VEAPTMCCIQAGKVALAAAGTMSAPKTMPAQRRVRLSCRDESHSLRTASRDDIDRNLLAAQIVGDVFSGDREGVTADGKIAGDGEDAGVGLGPRVPAQGGRSDAVDVGRQGARGRGRGSANLERPTPVRA